MKKIKTRSCKKELPLLEPEASGDLSKEPKL